MAITPTSLPAVSNGQVGAIADVNAAWTAVDELTGALSGWTATTVVYTSAGGDQTSALNTWLANGVGVKQAVGSFNVSDTLAVPDGVFFDISRATITQTANNKVTMTLGNKATLFGGELVGKGSDYVAGGLQSAVGVLTSSTDGASVRGTRFTNFSSAAIRALTATNFSVSDVTIVGVGTAEITGGDTAPCHGILLDDSTVNTSISNVDISETCQGILTGVTVTHLTMTGIRIHDVRGQHGCYIQNGTGVNIAGLDMWNIPAMGCKLQMYSGNTADSVATSITGVTANNVTDIALLVYNVDADLTSSYRYRAVTVSNVAAANCGRGLYLGSVRGGTVTNVSVYNCSSDAITFLDCANIIGGSLVVDTCGRVGVRFTSSTGSTQDQIDLDGIRIHNAANDNVASNIFGVYLAEGTNISLNRLRVTATNGFMQYGLFLASAVVADQQTFVLRGADLSGDTGASARFQASVTTVKDWINNRLSGTITNTPTGVAALTTVAPRPGNVGMKAWSADLAATSGGGLMTAATHYVIKMFVSGIQPIASVLMNTTVAATTAASAYVALYNSSGNLISGTQSADISATWNAAAGGKTFALGASATVTDDFVYVSVWINSAATMPTVARSGSGSVVNLGTVNGVTSATSPRWGTSPNAYTSSGTVAPATLGSITSQVNAWMAGLS